MTWVRRPGKAWEPLRRSDDLTSGWSAGMGVTPVICVTYFSYFPMGQGTHRNVTGVLLLPSWESLLPFPFLIFFKARSSISELSEDLCLGPVNRLSYLKNPSFWWRLRFLSLSSIGYLVMHLHWLLFSVISFLVSFFRLFCNFSGYRFFRGL